MKKVEWRGGMVPEDMAGVIRSEEVYRRESVPGGFDSDIVGKSVKFKLDRAKLEAVTEDSRLARDMGNMTTREHRLL